MNGITQTLARECIQKMSLFAFHELQLENVINFCSIILNVFPVTTFKKRVHVFLETK